MPVESTVFNIIEMQTSGRQTAIPPIISRTDPDEAESEFHRLCSIAAISSVPIHTIVMMDEYGNVLRSEHYEHEVVSDGQ